ncbi:MAG: DUF4136 domain-containing protein [Bacteroidetes bacterium]|nr:DUF4136 domain-containing protein [Bacteroidota bacterium]
MKTLCYRALLLCAIAGLSACSSYNYYTAGLNKTNMSGYHSFAWLPPQAGKKSDMSRVADLKVKDAAVASLSAKGLRLQNNDPDLLVTYSAMVGRGSKTVMTPTYYGGGGIYPYSGFGWGYGWGWGGWYSPYAFGTPFTYYGGYTATGKEHYKEGTIIIDMIDTRTHKIVWRGFGVGEVHKNMQKDIDDLPKVVSGIIDQLQLMPSRRT